MLTGNVSRIFFRDTLFFPMRITQKYTNKRQTWRIPQEYVEKPGGGVRVSHFLYRDYSVCVYSRGFRCQTL
jgi:hypothetical protein